MCVIVLHYIKKYVCRLYNIHCHEVCTLIRVEYRADRNIISNAFMKRL